MGFWKKLFGGGRSKDKRQSENVEAQPDSKETTAQVSVEEKFLELQSRHRQLTMDYLKPSGGPEAFRRTEQEMKETVSKIAQLGPSAIPSIMEMVLSDLGWRVSDGLDFLKEMSSINPDSKEHIVDALLPVLDQMKHHRYIADDIVDGIRGDVDQKVEGLDGQDELSGTLDMSQVLGSQSVTFETPFKSPPQITWELACSASTEDLGHVVIDQRTETGFLIHNGTTNSGFIGNHFIYLHWKAVGLFSEEVAEVVDQPMEEGEPEPPPVTCSDDVYALSDQEALAELVFNHDDPAVRNTATGLIDNVTLLTDIVDKTNDEKIRETAEKKLETLEIISALEKYDDKDEAKSMVEKQKDDLILAGIAMSHLPTDIRELAIRKIDEYKVLADVAKYEKTRQISSNYDAVFRLNEALACRANSGTVAAVEELVRLGADVNNTARPFKCTPLHEAATGGNVEVAEFLIKQGANVNAKNTEGTTPLNNKVGSGGDRMVEMVELLVKHGADVNSVGNNGYSVLDQAVMYSPAVVDFLVEHGAQNRRK